MAIYLDFYIDEETLLLLLIFTNLPESEQDIILEQIERGQDN